MIHVLLIEDDDQHAEMIISALRGIVLTSRVSHADEGLAMLGWAVPDVVLSDVRGTSDASPAELAASLRIALDAASVRVGASAPVPLVLTSALDPDALHDAAAPLHATHALPKPFSPSALRALVARLTGVTA